MSAETGEAGPSPAGSAVASSHAGSRPATARRRISLSALAAILALGVVLFGHYAALAHVLADELANFRCQALILCAALVVWMAFKGRRSWALVTAFLTLVAAVPLVALYIPGTQPASGSTQVRLLCCNVRMDNRQHDKVSGLIQSENPDIICLIELNSRWEKELAPVLEQYPHRVGPILGNLVCSRFPLKPFDFKHPFFGPLFHLAASATCEVDGQPVLILCTHPSSPVSIARLEERDAQLRMLSPPLANLPPFYHLVVAGDFNATTGCRSMRQFLRITRLRDTRQGFGLQNSWPANFWPIAICIDHVFVSDGVHVHNRRRGVNVGSDHWPVLVDMSFGPHPRGKPAAVPE